MNYYVLNVSGQQILSPPDFPFPFLMEKKKTTFWRSEERKECLALLHGKEDMLIL